MKHLTRILSFAACVCSAGVASGANFPDFSQSSNSNSTVSPVDLYISPSATSQIETIDLTARESDIWGRIRKGFGMADLDNEVVRDRVKWYASHPQQIQALLSRGNKYLYHVVSELEKRGMPTELALLPMVESAYNPMAMSPANAAGLWQFIPSTGKDFNLKQNWWVDERRDVVASTNAALLYLQAVYELHGDWFLALASYNWGENAVARAINSNLAAGKPGDYTNLKMPQETRNYVPALQAIKNIVAHPERYGVVLPDVPNEPYFVEVKKPQNIDIAIAAKLAEMPESEFRALNPSYNRPLIPGGKDSPLILPVANAEKFTRNLSTYAAPLSIWQTYSLPRGARVEELAQGLEMALDTLRTTNGIPARAKLAAGYTLLIPIAAAGRLHELLTSTPEPVERAPKAKAAPKSKVFRKK